MKLTLEWLSSFTPIQVPEKQFSDAMTMSGSKVESYQQLGSDLNGIVAGRIIALNKHPDADKLQICKVDIGEYTVSIVTGATNVYPGCVVPVALDGATLPGGVTIRAGKLRGQISEGMLCSVTELGCSAADFPEADPDGIFLLPDDTLPGQDIKKMLHLDDVMLDFEITSNRVDCFSVEGIGREAAVTFNQPFSPVLPAVRADGPEKSEDLASVRIEAPDLCSRYCARVVTNVRIGPSEEWLRRRLRGAGLRPINNIVDITNYVMLELGQPMHAFDLDQLAGRQIIVRRAASGETMRTLDRIDRQLDSSTLVIADRERAVALAGVMGAENSEITDSTTSIMFESANFNAPSVRHTARKVGLRTESSARFEKGLDACNAGRAIDRACQLVEQMNAGVICQGMIDVWPVKRQPVIVPFSPDSINAFLGTDIDQDRILATLSKLEINVRPAGSTFEAIIPSFRPDLACEADLAEEVARFYGYNQIKPSLLSGKQTTLGGRTSAQQTIEKIKDLMVSQGFYEACTYSFESPRQLDKLMVPESHLLRRCVTIQNPLGEDFSVMRTSMIPSLLQVAATNWSRSAEKADVFEIAFVYRPKSLPLADLPDEIRHLAAFCYDESSRDTGGEYFRLKGVAEELFLHLGLMNVEFEPLTDCPWLHPGRSARVLAGGLEIGSIGIVHPDIAENFGASPRTALLDLELAPVLAAATEKRSNKPLPRFPAVARDLSVTVGTEVPVARLTAAIRAAGGQFLDQIRLFDVYQGPQAGSGKKSVAFSLSFRSADRTLSDDVIQPYMNSILRELGDRFQAVLRT